MSSENFQELLQTAYESIENDDLVAAMGVAKTILNADSEHPYGLEVMGYLLLELNCLDEAKFCFSKSIENGNNENHTPYLYLGQLTSGDESVNYFLKAVDMMKLYLVKKDEKSRLFKPTQLDVSNCYVSISEIYMTDLCDIEDAEEKCRKYIDEAIKEDDTNPASWQALASLNLIKNDKESCKTNISKSLSLWLTAAMDLVAQAKESDDEISSTSELSTELRIKCAEILFELTMFDEMKSVLETVLTEDEEHMQANYLMATMLNSQMAPLIEDNSPEMIETLLNHAETALSLADPDVEGEAVAKMQSIIEKYDTNAAEPCMDVADQSGDDDSDDDDDNIME